MLGLLVADFYLRIVLSQRKTSHSRSHAPSQGQPTSSASQHKVIKDRLLLYLERSLKDHASSRNQEVSTWAFDVTVFSSSQPSPVLSFLEKLILEVLPSGIFAGRSHITKSETVLW